MFDVCCSCQRLQIPLILPILLNFPRHSYSESLCLEALSAVVHGYTAALLVWWYHVGRGSIPILS